MGIKKNNPGCGCCGSCDCPINCANSLEVYEPSGITAVISGIPDTVFAGQLTAGSPTRFRLYGITSGLSAINDTYALERTTGCNWRYTETFDCSFRPSQIFDRYGSPPAIANCPDPDFPFTSQPDIIETTFELRITVTYNAASKAFSPVTMQVICENDTVISLVAPNLVYCEGVTLSLTGTTCPAEDFDFLPLGDYVAITITNDPNNTCPDQEEVEPEPP